MAEEKRYKVLVLGATFAAAGLAQALGEHCLVADRCGQPGWEFTGALQFGTAYETPLRTAAAEALRQEWEQSGCFAAGGRINLLDGSAALCRRLQACGSTVLLQSETVAIEKIPAGFAVTTHGAAGYRTWLAERVIDTRCPAAGIAHKSFHALLHTDAAPAQAIAAQVQAIAAPVLPPDILTENWGGEGDFVLKCPVAADASWPQARAALAALLRRLPAGFRPVLTADAFACVPAADVPKTQDGVEMLISCGYANPLLAFDAGVLCGEEVLRHAAF